MFFLQKMDTVQIEIMSAIEPETHVSLYPDDKVYTWEIFDSIWGVDNDFLSAYWLDDEDDFKDYMKIEEMLAFLEKYKSKSVMKQIYGNNASRRRK